jgi:predicted negative regulator of RcsB-dependent stress response
MAKRLSSALLRQAMAQIGAKGGKRSLETMTAEQRSARAKEASLAAAKKRTAARRAKQAKRKLNTK